MSLYEFQNKITPGVVQSLFRRELGSFGILRRDQNQLKDSTTAIDVVIHRQLIQARAQKFLNSQPRILYETSETQVSETLKNNKYLKKNILIKKWKNPENSHVLVLDDKVYIRNGKDGMPYVSYIIDTPKLVLKPMYSIPSMKIWSDWDVWWPSIEATSNTQFKKQHSILFVLEKPGNILQSFYFETGKKYKTFYLDPEVQFGSIELTEKIININCVKATLKTTCDHAMADFIILSVPELQLVTRCRMAKAAVDNSRVEVRGEFIFLFTEQCIEICDLKKTIEASYHLEPVGYVPKEERMEGISVTHMVIERPEAIFIVRNADSYLVLVQDIWPPHYIKKNRQHTFQVLPINEQELKVENSELLNLVDKIVPHNEDVLSVHPDESGRLILTGHYEIRVILVNRFDIAECKKRRTGLTVQFFKTMAKSSTPKTESSLRSGLRTIKSRSYEENQSDEDLGIIRWEYFSKLDIFVILEFSSTKFELNLYDNQTWAALASINLFDLSPLHTPRSLRLDLDFLPKNFVMGVTDSFIIIQRTGKTARQVTNLCVINLLDDASDLVLDY